MRRKPTALAVIGTGLVFAAATALAATGGRAETDRPGGPRRPPSEVVRPPDGSAPLQTRLDWALGRAPPSGAAQAFWVGYSVEKPLS